MDENYPLLSNGFRLQYYSLMSTFLSPIQSLYFRPQTISNCPSSILVHYVFCFHLLTELVSEYNSLLCLTNLLRSIYNHHINCYEICYRLDNLLVGFLHCPFSVFFLMLNLNQDNGIKPSINIMVSILKGPSLQHMEYCILSGLELSNIQHYVESLYLVTTRRVQLSEMVR